MYWPDTSQMRTEIDLTSMYPPLETYFRTDLISSHYYTGSKTMKFIMVYGSHFS